ncbi:uncharacterized protein LOC141544746 [Sminthopsis crassicaudata]|uniref:uncharacterized protein LOC141544746 n=1 Tax=Sminthopsis crassicaudata TaxID=9301 RepID=UPI003D6958AC
MSHRGPCPAGVKRVPNRKPEAGARCERGTENETLDGHCADFCESTTLTQNTGYRTVTNAYGTGGADGKMESTHGPAAHRWGDPDRANPEGFTTLPCHGPSCGGGEPAHGGPEARRGRDVQLGHVTGSAQTFTFSAASVVMIGAGRWGGQRHGPSRAPGRVREPAPGVTGRLGAAPWSFRFRCGPQSRRRPRVGAAQVKVPTAAVSVEGLLPPVIKQEPSSVTLEAPLASNPRPSKPRPSLAPEAPARCWGAEFAKAAAGRGSSASADRTTTVCYSPPPASGAGAACARAACARARRFLPAPRRGSVAAEPPNPLPPPCQTEHHFLAQAPSWALAPFLRRIPDFRPAASAAPSPQLVPRAPGQAPPLTPASPEKGSHKALAAGLGLPGRSLQALDNVHLRAPRLEFGTRPRRPGHSADASGTIRGPVWLRAAPHPLLGSGALSPKPVECKAGLLCHRLSLPGP